GKFFEPFSPNVEFINGLKFTVDYSDPTKVVLTRALATATVGLTSSANPSVFGQAVTFTATVTPEPGSGTVSDSDFVTFTLSQGATVITTAKIHLTSGKAVFDPTALGFPLAVGTYTVNATFNQDGEDTTFNSPTPPPLTQ